MLAEVGPGSYAERADVPDTTADGRARIVPLRVATDYAVEVRDGDPRGYALIGGDKSAAGTITDVWVDRSEQIIRYLEADIPGVGARLVPMNFARVDKRRGTVNVHALFAQHFANVPAIANPDSVTRLEEDKICGYYGAGTLYAHPTRTEVLL